MIIYEYRNHLINGHIHDPEFITNGGHWYDPTTDTYIAVMEDNLPYYIPDTLVTLTIEQLITRIKTIHVDKPFKKRIGVLGSGGIETDDDMTEEDIKNMVSDWFDNINTYQK